MILSEEIDDIGEWWLPESPEHRVHGTLIFNEDGGALRLDGELRKPEWFDNVLGDGTIQRVRANLDEDDESRTYPRIYGRTSRTVYHLESCFRTGLAPSFAGEGQLATETVHVNAIFRHAQFEGDGAPAFDRCIVGLRHLTAWVPLSGLVYDDLPMPRTDDTFVIARARTLPGMSGSLASGYKVAFGQSLQQMNDAPYRVGIEQVWELILSHDTLHPADEFIEIASDVQDLLTIAIGSTADFSGVRFQHPDLPRRSAGGRPIRNWRQPVDYFVQWVNRSSDDARIDRRLMFFDFGDLGGIDGVIRWLDTAAQHRTELGRVMATRYSSSMYLEDRISNCFAALESVDHQQKQDKVQDLAVRLRRCAALAGQPFLDLIGGSSRLDQWITEAKRRRDDLAHHKAHRFAQPSNVQHTLAEQLYWLFALCMLRLADAPDSVFDRITDHQQFQWLQARA